ncbi:MAG: Rieske (2Fe-2S) protein [Adhaeribacter sp.]
MRNLLGALGLALLAACGRDTPAPAMPYVTVNEQINLTNIQYNALRQENGFVYLNAGLRGIILIRRGPNRYVALERTCTYQPANTCARVEVDGSGLFLIDPCCQSQFDLSGQVLARPATYPLRHYATATSGNFLYITN